MVGNNKKDLKISKTVCLTIGELELLEKLSVKLKHRSVNKTMTEAIQQYLNKND